MKLFNSRFLILISFAVCNCANLSEEADKKDDNAIYAKVDSANIVSPRSHKAEKEGTLSIDLESLEVSKEIPQGSFFFELYFAEWGGRMGNTECLVIIEGIKITVEQTEKTNLTGGKVLVEGYLIKHNTGVWIIADSLDDKNAEEIGGCTGGPLPIDFKNKVIEWC